ncbi:MAG: hypothetical protein FJ267_01175 [Planctomycetes bacterium]|nr:hypothetical protein [Planctomycetota bacterium]
MCENNDELPFREMMTMLLRRRLGFHLDEFDFPEIMLGTLKRDQYSVLGVTNNHNLNRSV